MFHNMRNTYVLTIRLLWIWLRLLNLVHHQVGIAYIYFGRDYGRFLFLIRLNILPRELLVIYCLLKITLITDISWWIAHVMNVGLATNLCSIYSGIVPRLRKCGLYQNFFMLCLCYTSGV